MTDVIMNSVSDSAVAVNLFKRDFPLIVALFSRHGNHRVKSRPVFETQISGVFDGFLEVFVTVNEEVTRYFLVGCSEIEG